MNGGLAWTAIAASCVLALGCSGSDERKNASGNADAGSSRDAGSGTGRGDAGPTDAGSGGTSAGSGGVGPAGAGSGGTSAGTGGQMGGDHNPNVPCGPTKCAGTDPATGMAMFGTQLGFNLTEVCCVDASLGICGAVSSPDMTCVAPLPADADCPLVMGHPGCCAGGTECGIDLTLVGQGCRALSTVMLPLKLRVQFDIPDPIGCDGKPLVIDADAGM